MDPCVDVKIITNDDLKENKSKSLLDVKQQFKEIKMPKNYKYVQYLIIKSKLVTNYV